MSKTHYELHVWIYYISKLLNASKFTNMINLEQHYFASQQLDRQNLDYRQKIASFLNLPYSSVASMTLLSGKVFTGN